MENKNREGRGDGETQREMVRTDPGAFAIIALSTRPTKKCTGAEFRAAFHQIIRRMTFQRITQRERNDQRTDN